MIYRTVFQCPVTGQTVLARYAFGRVSLIAADCDEYPETTEDTIAWCKRYHGKRFFTVDAANEYICRISDYQNNGFAVG